MTSAMNAITILTATMINFVQHNFRHHFHIPHTCTNHYQKVFLKMSTTGRQCQNHQNYQGKDENESKALDFNLISLSKSQS